jgi:hypothetical protein
VKILSWFVRIAATGVVGWSIVFRVVIAVSLQTHILEPNAGEKVSDRGEMNLAP